MSQPQKIFSQPIPFYGKKFWRYKLISLESKLYLFLYLHYCRKWKSVDRIVNRGKFERQFVGISTSSFITHPPAKIHMPTISVLVEYCFLSFLEGHGVFWIWTWAESVCSHRTGTSTWDGQKVEPSRGDTRVRDTPALHRGLPADWSALSTGVPEHR